jgi:hypothetical protein
MTNIINTNINIKISDLLSETYNLSTNLVNIESDDIFLNINKYKTLINNTGYINHYLFDLIIISKLYAIIHRLYWYHYNITCKTDKVKWMKFCNEQTIILHDNNEKSKIIDNVIHIYKLFDISDLKLNSIDLIDYNSFYNIDTTILNKYNEYNDKNIPLYNKFDNNTIKILNIDLSAITPNTDILYKIDGFSQLTNLTELTFTNYAYNRVSLYIDEIKNILLLDSNNFNLTLKYKLYYYNFLLYNAIIQAKLSDLKDKYNIVKDDSSSPEGSKQTANTNITTIITEINILNNNLNYIAKLSYSEKPQKKTISNIIKILDIKDINNSIISFSKITDKYKDEWKIYSRGLFYYRLLLIIIIIIFIIIVIISNLLIDTNIIIKIFIIKLLLIFFIILLLYYYKKPQIEHFTELSSRQLINDSFNNYKTNANVYKNFINNFFNNENTYDYKKLRLDDLKFKNSYEYKLLESNSIDNLSYTEYEKKLEYYKIKSIDLEDAIKVLKISNNQNYYIILMIYYTFIFALIGLICYYQYPDKFYTIIGFISILFIIMVIIISIKMHKSNNTNNNNYYWSNLNPSSLDEND